MCESNQQTIKSNITFSFANSSDRTSTMRNKTVCRNFSIPKSDNLELNQIT